MNHGVRILIVFAIPALSACAMASRVTQGPAQDLPALATTPPGLPASATQTLHAAFGQQEATLQCSFAADRGGWRTSCISPTGMRVLTLTVDAQGVLSYEAGVGVPKQFDPRSIAADLQFAFWPLRALQDAQAGGGWTLSEPVAGMRRLQHDRRLVAEVHYAVADPWNGRLWISNYRYGYSLQIDSHSDRTIHAQ